MYLVDSRDKEYRHGDHGPKYLMKGPRSNFGLCQLRPGGGGNTTCTSDYGREFLCP